MDTDNDNNTVDVALLFQKPVDTAFELVKTFWIEHKEELNESPPTQEEETKPLQPLDLKTDPESAKSSCSEAGLPDDLLNEPLDDDVFEESNEDVETDLMFQQPKEREVELVYTILEAENHMENSDVKDTNFEEPAVIETSIKEDSEDQKVDVVDVDVSDNSPSEIETTVDLLFREPTHSSFELVYTIPLMEDVTVENPDNVLAQVLEMIPPPEELDNVVESVEADEVSAAEFTFSPIKQTSGDEETVTAEVVTVLENRNMGENDMGSEEARDFIEKVKLTSDDTFDDVEDPKEGEAFQNAFVKSVETPPPDEDVPGDQPDDQLEKDLFDSKEIDTAELTRKLSALADGMLPVDSSETTDDVNETMESSEAVQAEQPDEISEEQVVPVHTPEDNLDTEKSEERAEVFSEVADEQEDVDFKLEDAPVVADEPLEEQPEPEQAAEKPEDVENVEEHTETVLEDDSVADAAAVDEKPVDEDPESEHVATSETVEALCAMADDPLPVDSVEDQSNDELLTDPSKEEVSAEIDEVGDEETFHDVPAKKTELPDDSTKPCVEAENTEVQEDSETVKKPFSPKLSDSEVADSTPTREENATNEENITEVAISTQEEKNLVTDATEEDEPKEIQPQEASEDVQEALTSNAGDVTEVNGDNNPIEETVEKVEMKLDETEPEQPIDLVPEQQEDVVDEAPEQKEADGPLEERVEDPETLEQTIPNVVLTPEEAPAENNEDSPEEHVNLNFEKAEDVVAEEQVTESPETIAVETELVFEKEPEAGENVVSVPTDEGQVEEAPLQPIVETETFERVKKALPEELNAEPVAEVASAEDVEESVPEDTVEKTMVTTQEASPQEPHRITDIHFEIPKEHPDFGNDYVPFGTEQNVFLGKPVEFNVPDDNEEEEEDVVAELSFQPVRQWRDEDVISLQSLKSLVAEVGCTTEEQKHEPENSEETLKILKVVPSEPSLMELDITNDPSIIHVPIPLLEPATKYLEDMVDWIIADAVKEVGEMEVVTESELCEMKEESASCPVPEPLEDMEFSFDEEVQEVQKEDDEKTPEPETRPEVLEDQDVRDTAPTPVGEEPVATPTAVVPVESAPVPQRPPRAPKQDSSSKSRVRFGPLSIKLGRSYSEEQKALEEMLEKPLEVIISSSQAAKKPEDVDEDDDGGLSPLSPGTLAEYEHVPMMDMRSVPHSPQEKQEEEPERVVETRILGAGKSVEDVGKQEEEDEEGSEYLDSIGDLSERTIQRFTTSIDDPSVRRDSFSSISSFGDRQKFQTAIENIRHDLLPFQSSVSQYLVPSANQTQLVANLSMDSPSDLSPNAPPVGFENTAQFLEKLQAEDRPSAEGSIDSSGFEKVDHEGLDDFQPVADPMQQSVFGSLQADADDAQTLQSDDGFVLIDKNEADIDGGKRNKMSSHDDVIEKNYFGEDPAASATAKLLESPIAEEARKLVQDAVASASEISKQAVDDADEIGKELLDNAEHKFEDVKEPVLDTLQKAHDGLGDFVHETVPHAVDDFIEKVNTPEPVHEKPASPVQEKPKTPEPPLLDIHDTVDKVHDEIDNFLRGRDPTPPLEADEDAQEQQPHFGNQTPEEDETTFDRKGPLTIPEEVEKAAAQKIEDDFSDFDPLVTANTGAAFGAAVSEALTEEEMFGHQKFETVPRPPTPPKDISDEDVKPSTVNLGPAHHHSHPSSPHHSILKHHGEAWIDFKTVPPCVLDVIYWRDAKKSAVVLSLALLALFILAKYPLLTVITYSLLLSLVAAAGFRVFKKVEAQIKKTDAEHPFSEILAQDLSLPQEKVHAQADVFVEHATCVANKLKKLVFVESPVESIKFGVVLWALTYVASWFSGFTIAILGLLGVFSVPKVYESNQDAIDPHLATISGHLKNVQNIIDEKLPFLRSAPVAAEEKKDQ